MPLAMPHGTLTRYADGSLSIVTETASMVFPATAVEAVLAYLNATDAALPAAKQAVAEAVAANEAESDAIVLHNAQAATEVAI